VSGSEPAAAALPAFGPSAMFCRVNENTMTKMTLTKKEPPEWLLAFRKPIDNNTCGKGFDCFPPAAIALIAATQRR
jgi:hypothetical protein